MCFKVLYNITNISILTIVNFNLILTEKQKRIRYTATNEESSEDELDFAENRELTNDVAFQLEHEVG